MGLPDIVIEFSKKAVVAIQSGALGLVGIILKDAKNISALLRVVCHSHAAVRAGYRASAKAATYEIVIASAIYKKNGLPVLFLIFYKLMC